MKLWNWMVTGQWDLSGKKWADLLQIWQREGSNMFQLHRPVYSPAPYYRVVYSPAPYSRRDYSPAPYMKTGKSLILSVRLEFPDI